MPLEAVIFDVDGTLAETEELHREAFNAAFAAHGRDWFWDRGLYRELLAVEGGPRRLRAYVERRRPRDLAALEHSGVFDAIHATKSAVYLGLLEEGLPLRPGVGRLINEVRARGLKLAACTTASREAFEAIILNAFGFEALDWFHAVVARDDVPAIKPDPAPYLEVLRRLGVPAARAVAIEDSGRGVAAARAAGVATVAAPGLHTREDDFAGARLVVSDLGERAAPFEVLAGDAGRHGWVSVDALREWTMPEAGAAAA